MTTDVAEVCWCRTRPEMHVTLRWLQGHRWWQHRLARSRSARRARTLRKRQRSNNQLLHTDS